MSSAHYSSPKIKRCSSDQNCLPVTPQRISNIQKQIRTVSSPIASGYSSVSSSPFSPLTNMYSSPLSVATPSSSVSSGTKVNMTPENLKIDSSCLADAVANWRTRAKENGIKVSLGKNSADEENSTSKGALPPPFRTTQRRSRASQFQAKSCDITAMTTPLAARINVLQQIDTNTPSPRKPVSSLNTPSPQTSLAIVEKLKNKGSLTEPAQPRRRIPFGVVNNGGLFDIDENSVNLSPYPQAYVSPLPMGRISRLRSASEPGAAFSIPSVNFASEIKQGRGLFHDFLAAETSTVCSDDNTLENAENENISNACSVCSSLTSQLSSLIPCTHLICSACLTSSLNIVGEKDMRCAMCESVVHDFKLLTPLVLNAAADEKSIEAPLANSLLPSFFDECRVNERKQNRYEVLAMSEAEPAFMIQKAVRQTTRSTDFAVLRIDNVPWDLTPSALTEFFKPIDINRAHVLLDSKGKTLSHAYVELPHGLAKQALRTVQNKTMGKGKRLRGVTVTLSSQSELMRALFPNWKGSFEGSKPSIAGMNQNDVTKALEGGLISLNELDSLITLMRKPDSHFLKVPSLPFYSLLSILVKFPSDIDSRVFWNSVLRDLLYHLTLAAVQALASRMKDNAEEQALFQQLGRAGSSCEAFTLQQRLTLARETEILMNTTCKEPASEADTRTPEHIPMLMTSSMMSDGSTSSRTSLESEMHAFGSDPTIIAFNELSSETPYDSLAREFGIEPNVVQALAQRLSMVST